MAENKKYLDMPGLAYFYNQIKSKFASKTDVGTPSTASTIAAMTDHNKVYVYTGSETGHTYGDWYFYEDGAWHSGGQYRANVYETDKTLSVADKPADAKKTGDEIADLKSALSGSIGDALLELFKNVAYISGNPNTLYNNLYVSLKGEESILYRPLTMNDIKSYVGINNFNVSNGTVTNTISDNSTFCAIVFKNNIKRVRMSNVSVSNVNKDTDCPMFLVYETEGDNLHVIDGTKGFLFTKNGSKYDAAAETLSSNIAITAVNDGDYDIVSPQHGVANNYEYSLTDGRLVLKANGTSAYLALTGATCIGVWGSGRSNGNTMWPMYVEVSEG